MIIMVMIIIIINMLQSKIKNIAERENGKERYINNNTAVIIIPETITFQHKCNIENNTNDQTNK